MLQDKKASGEKRDSQDQEVKIQASGKAQKHLLSLHYQHVIVAAGDRGIPGMQGLKGDQGERGAEGSSGMSQVICFCVKIPAQ